VYALAAPDHAGYYPLADRDGHRGTNGQSITGYDADTFGTAGHSDGHRVRRSPFRVR
jgi:hypothetical protein